MKEDERTLMKALATEGRHTRDVVDDLGMNHKRAAYILEKWTDKGWWDYGVSVMAGWFTERGVEWIEENPEVET